MTARPFSILTLAVILSATPMLAASPGIIVRTDVPYGNAANVRVSKAGSVTEVHFTPDPHGGPECLWLCFRVCRSQSGDGALGWVRHVLECPETMLGGGQPADFRPVFRPAGGDWERTGRGCISSRASTPARSAARGCSTAWCGPADMVRWPNQNRTLNRC